MHETREWHSQAACLNADPELFFPVSEFGPSSDQVGEAKQICHSCPVQWTCLTWALRNRVSDGIWGGTNEAERRMMLGRVPRGGLIPMQAMPGLSS